MRRAEVVASVVGMIHDDRAVRHCAQVYRSCTARAGIAQWGGDRGRLMFRRGRTNEAIAFAFSGGGARAATQLGAVRALHEADIWPSIIAGTSAGAVNAAWLGLEPRRLDRLQETWLALRTRDVFPGRMITQFVGALRRGALHKSASWERVLRNAFGDARFEDMAVPVGVVAARLSDGRRVVFESGEIVPALMASTAIPGIFPEYRIGDEWYVDGGVIEYLPVPTVMERGAAVVYALDCSAFFSDGGHRAVMDRAGLIGSTAAADQVTSSLFARGRVIHRIRPETPYLRDGRDFSRTAELIEVGYRETCAYLTDHRGIGHRETTAG